MLAFGQHNLGLCDGLRPKFWGLQLSFGAFGQVLRPSAQFQGLWPSTGGDTQTNTNTAIVYIYMSMMLQSLWLAPISIT